MVTVSLRPRTGFQLWLEENRKSITADHPDLEETDVIKEAMGRFRTLSAEERLVRSTEGGVNITFTLPSLKCPKKKRTNSTKMSCNLLSKFW